MFGDLIANKYFIIALVIALLLVLYMYYQKKMCDLEDTKKLNLSYLLHNFFKSSKIPTKDQMYKNYVNRDQCKN